MRGWRFQPAIVAECNAKRGKFLTQHTQLFLDAGKARFLSSNVRVERSDHLVLKRKTRFKLIESIDNLLGGRIHCAAIKEKGSPIVCSSYAGCRSIPVRRTPRAVHDSDSPA